MVLMLTYILVSVVMSILMWALMYFDTKLFDQKKTKWTYFKNMLATGLLTTFALYLGKLVGTTSVAQMGGGLGTTYLPDVGQDILSGIPPF